VSASMPLLREQSSCTPESSSESQSRARFQTKPRTSRPCVRVSFVLPEWYESDDRIPERIHWFAEPDKCVDHVVVQISLTGLAYNQAQLFSLLASARLCSGSSSKSNLAMSVTVPISCRPPLSLLCQSGGAGCEHLRRSEIYHGTKTEFVRYCADACLCQKTLQPLQCTALSPDPNLRHQSKDLSL